MTLDFNKDYSDELFLSWCNNDVDMFKYLRGYDFCLDRMKKAK
jgi:hypothetical protein